MVHCPFKRVKPCLNAAFWFQGLKRIAKPRDMVHIELVSGDPPAGGPPAYSRGVLVEGGAAGPRPGSIRPAGPTGHTGPLSGLHPGARRPPALPPSPRPGSEAWDRLHLFARCRRKTDPMWKKRAPRDVQVSSELQAPRGAGVQVLCREAGGRLSRTRSNRRDQKQNKNS